MSSNIDRVKQAGVVGAGGAGFPTHVKLGASAEIIIANGAECEPLLRVDQQVMEYDTKLVVDGVRLAMEMTGANKGVICLKAKYKNAIARLEEVLENEEADISLLKLDNYYPSGDEQALVFEATGKVVPTGGIPIAAGAIVLNVSTLTNIAEAVEEIPVTQKYVTITGAVENPTTVKVPVGTKVSELVRYAGGPTREDGYEIILGGPAMGAVCEDWDTPVTKTLGGIIVLPAEHNLIYKKTAPLDYQIKLSRSVCCQCNQCTMLCPRRTLGLETAPHMAMRALAYGSGAGLSPESIVSCCECGICTYFACTMGLMPSRVMGSMRGEILSKRVPFEKTESIGASKDRPYKNLPVNRLINRLGLKRYDVAAPMEQEPLSIDQVVIPLRQHIGAPSEPCVSEGQRVTTGDLIAKIPDEALGANIHASISGTVHSIKDGYIEIRGNGEGR